MAEIPVEVAFALPERQAVVALSVPLGTTAREAVALADLPAHFPELPRDTFDQADLGIFGRRLREPSDQRLRAGDRVEIYRPLTIDPMAARQARAAREKG
ncbi:RnfH family protein [Halomonas sp. BM-2019]|uniref:RnfH family protein n=1 Tax=Halomonas sp. BM-2019 TaxID=2811227 RepID=UPI001B3C2695|nr:MAG: RnfH family protein [Halomonas sp. BM-2019]